MGMHRIAIGLDDKRFDKLKELQRKTKLVYDDLIAKLIDEAS